MTLTHRMIREADGGQMPTVAARVAGPVVLHDVDNLEAFCAGIVAKALDQRGVHLTPGRRDEAVEWLVSEAGLVAARFDPLRTASFELYARWVLRDRMNSWYRETLGDTRAEMRRERPPDVSLTELADDAHPAGSVEHEVLSRVSFG